MAKSKTNTGSSSSELTSGKSSSSASRRSSSSSSMMSADGSGKTLEHLFAETLKDIYSAEKQLIEALPELARAADDEDLSNAFTDHLEQTKKQAERLEKIFTRLGVSAEEETKCEAMESLINEGKKVLNELEMGPVRDAALIIGSQKIEHYEIAAYGSLRELAELLGMHKIADVLERTLEEEEETDRLLTEIAESVNEEAYELSSQEQEAY